VLDAKDTGSIPQRDLVVRRVRRYPLRRARSGVVGSPSRAFSVAIPSLLALWVQIGRLPT